MPSSKIGEVVQGMPASEAGMQTGDQIIEIAGIGVSNWMELTKEIRKYPGDSNPSASNKILSNNIMFGIVVYSGTSQSTFDK